jgi:aspartyl-tRNA(Asn)/glutamyl-tRNA(Gln) amidotransferase subunit A
MTIRLSRSMPEEDEVIEKLATALRGRAVSSVDLTKDALHRAGQHANLNAFITLTGDEALDEARQRDAELNRGEVRGPLHGIPIALKDIFWTKGARTTCGSRIFRDFVPDRDADVVVRLRKAGAVVIGKTGLHELAYGITSNNPHFGAVRNAHDPERIPGGSSGGSGTAVAAGVCAMALGSDTGGSIRIPASFCGVAGFKPTYGVVSRRGVFPLGFSLDHVGPLAASVRDCAITMAAIADRDQNWQIPTQPSISGVRIGRPENFYFEKLESGVASALEGAFRSAAERGAEIVPVRVPDMESFNAAALAVLLGEAAAALEPHRSRRDEIGPDVRLLLDQGWMLPASTYVNAQRVRARFVAEFSKVWKNCDLLFLPATPTTAPKIGQTTVDIGSGPEDVRLLTTRCVRAINALGWPALTIPCGMSANLPVGLQIVGPAFSDAAVLRYGAALENA